MIALHLDAATYGICDAWHELASCFLRLSQCEEDRISTLGVGSDPYGQGHLENSNKIPDLFTNGESGKTWRLRARWWLNRHFHYRILMSDISSGNRISFSFFSFYFSDGKNCYRSRVPAIDSSSTQISISFSFC